MTFFAIRAKTLLASLLVIFSFVLGAVFVEYTPVFKVGSREIPIYSVERDDNKIALTFNCAWGNEDIEKIIEILNKHNAQATFFLVGDWAEKYPDSLKLLADNNFEIGNHSYNHAHYSKMSKQEIVLDMDKADAIIEKATGQKPYLFRAAYGEYTNDVVSACDETGRVYIQWSVDSLDYKADSPEKIISRVLDKVSSGDIILMHTGTSHTVHALDSLLSQLEKDYTLSKVSDLIYKDNYIINGEGRQILKDS